MRIISVADSSDRSINIRSEGGDLIVGQLTQIAILIAVNISVLIGFGEELAKTVVGVIHVVVTSVRDSLPGTLVICRDVRRRQSPVESTFNSLT